MENMEMNKNYWNGRRVLITGHTGFKGGWLALWLCSMGAKVYGYSLQADCHSGIYCAARVAELLEGECVSDIRDKEALTNFLDQIMPEVVFHLAAQPLVLASYVDPYETFSVNVLGTVNLLQLLKEMACVKAVVIVTSDKCYSNKEWAWSYREADELGGHDPYSGSKACQELAVSSMRDSFFVEESAPLIATARAGNVIGGGDWACGRIIPDIIRAISKRRSLEIRNPSSIRPWQHVFDCLHGYLMFADYLLARDGNSKLLACNFGPSLDSQMMVIDLVNLVKSKSSNSFDFHVNENVKNTRRESILLTLDSSLAHNVLGWRPRWGASRAIENTLDWYQLQERGANMQDVSLKLLDEFVKSSVID